MSDSLQQDLFQQLRQQDLGALVLLRSVKSQYRVLLQMTDLMVQCSIIRSVEDEVQFRGMEVNEIDLQDEFNKRVAEYCVEDFINDFTWSQLGMAFDAAIKFQFRANFSTLTKLPLSILLAVIANLDYRATLNLYKTCRAMYLFMISNITGKYARLRTQRHAWWNLELAFKIIEMKKDIILAHDIKMRLRDEVLVPLGPCTLGTKGSDLSERDFDELCSLRPEIISAWQKMFGNRQDLAINVAPDKDQKKGEEPEHDEVGAVGRRDCESVYNSGKHL